MAAFTGLYDELAPDVPIRRLGLSLTGVLPAQYRAYDLFTPPHQPEEERRRAQAVSAVKSRFGRNVILLGSSLLPASTARERNMQVGGHHE